MPQDVLLPYLVTDVEHIAVFEKIAKESGAEFFEILLSVEKDEAVRRLLERGRWGEEGSKQLTEKDIPHIENLYDLMMRESEKRPNVAKVVAGYGKCSDTYRQVLKIVS